MRIDLPPDTTKLSPEEQRQYKALVNLYASKLLEKTAERPSFIREMYAEMKRQGVLTK